MDNRHGLITDVLIFPSVGVSESEVALLLLARQRRKRLRPKHVGADKGYHTHGFGEVPREKRIAAHMALNERYHALGLGPRGYAKFVPIAPPRSFARESSTCLAGAKHYAATRSSCT
jgi:hypothetical protein